MQNDLFNPSQGPVHFLANCDGACKGNPGLGGWGLLLQDAATKELVDEAFGGALVTTNNQMELTAAIETLKRVPEGAVIEIRTDSQYVIKGITEWLPNWKRRNWTTADKKPVKNGDLWRALDALYSKRKVTMTWVRGHNGDPGNERADFLANEGVAKARSGA